MHDVTEIIFDCPVATHLWANERVRKAIGNDADARFLMQLKRCCKNGFYLYERGNSPPIKFEWDAVYRIGTGASLFRLIGFYEDGTAKAHFICLDAFEKGGQKLKSVERDRIDEVARIKRLQLWRRSPDERFPRLAQNS